jgi:hypothetical protein
MALLDTAAQNASLDNDYGATKGPNAAAAHQLALFAGDPQAGGVELDNTVGGYARVTITNNGTNWPAASGGAKTATFQAYAASTDAWSAVATHWVLFDAADGTTRWDSGRLDTAISVDGPGETPNVAPTVYYNTTGGS